MFDPSIRNLSFWGVAVFLEREVVENRSLWLYTGTRVQRGEDTIEMLYSTEEEFGRKEECQEAVKHMRSNLRLHTGLP